MHMISCSRAPRTAALLSRLFYAPCGWSQKRVGVTDFHAPVFFFKNLRLLVERCENLINVSVQKHSKAYNCNELLPLNSIGQQVKK